MQLTNSPGKLVLPFANAGAKNTIPTASQISITAGAASLTDGFPPLTRTPIAAGGVPPSGLDMNGILYELSAAIRWANAGGGYVYDGVFASNSNVGGYPKGARVLRSDGTGYWLNTIDGNTINPESVTVNAAQLAGWVPDMTNGIAAITMTSANVTMTPAQYGKPIVVLSGVLTANLNLIFPNLAGEWTVINNTTGAYSITCKTAAGTGVVVNSAQPVVGDGTNIYSAVNDTISLLGENVAYAAGTADALTATFSPAPHSWPDGIPFFVRAASANATTTPTFTPNSGTLAAKTIVKGANAALAAGDIAGAGHWLMLQYDVTLDKVVLLNPATGVVAPTNPVGTIVYLAQSTPPTGYLKANGAALSRTTYAALFAAIGTAFGAGDGSTTFNIPDLRGEFVRGWDDSRGVDSGRSFASSQADAMQDHTHPQSIGGTNPTKTYSSGDPTSLARDVGSTGTEVASRRFATHEASIVTANRTAAETRPRNVALLACIKY